VWVADVVGRTYMKQRAITRDIFPIGGRVTLAGLPSRFSLSEMFMGNVLSSNGEELLLAGGAEPRWTIRNQDVELPGAYSGERGGPDIAYGCPVLPVRRR
jgi:hypothetical protein